MLDRTPVRRYYDRVRTNRTLRGLARTGNSRSAGATNPATPGL